MSMNPHIRDVVVEHMLARVGESWMPKMHQVQSAYERTADSRAPSQRPRSSFGSTPTEYDIATGRPVSRDVLPDPTRRRAYHNTEHLARVWITLREWNVADARAAVFTTFHDWVYYARPAYQGQNEQESAEAMLQAIRVGEAVSAHDVGTIAWGILATAHHDAHQNGLPIAIQHWLDADMASMADPAPDYQASSRALLEESGGGPEWRERRGAFLQKLLSRPSVFYTSRAQASLEDRARSNAERELRALSGDFDASPSQDPAAT